MCGGSARSVAWNACASVSCRTELQRLPDGAQRSRDILLAIQGQRKVELIIGIVGIGGHRLLEKGGGVQTPAARRDTLVVDHFRAAATAG